MIEIGSEKDDKYGFTDYLVVDGVRFTQPKVSVISGAAPGMPILIFIGDRQLSQQICAHRFRDLPMIRGLFTLPLDLEWIDLTVESRIYKSPYIFQLFFDFHFQYAQWKRPWSIAEYKEKFRSIAKAEKVPDLLWKPIDDDGNGDVVVPLETQARFLIGFLVTDPETQIDSEITKHVEPIRKIHELTIAALEAEAHANAVVTYFDFPEHVKVPCQQYLLYFVQFLKDVGVDATAKLEEHAGRVLFAVTPTDGDVALEKIQEALHIYLKLPKRANVDMVPYDADIEVQRLVATIDHYRAQMRLAHVTVTQQEKLIQQKDDLIQQQQLLTGQVLISSIHHSEPAKESDEESLVGDLVKVKPYETHGVKFDLPKLLRWAKGFFADEEQQES